MSIADDYMNKIKILPKKLIAKIAAGEVVERPASVVKELVENSLDAGATRIKVSLEDAGTKKIVVTDNGHGISRDDIALAPEQHATSKLSDMADLERIRTLGFRGEALSSIAAVSLLTIISRTADETIGSKVTAIEGQIESVEPSGSPVGTTVIVDGLFSSVPARKKYLKTHPTEMRHIMAVLSQAALMHPQVYISITHNSRSMRTFHPEDDHLVRVTDVLGTDISQHMIAMERNSPHLGISGFIGKPQIAEHRRELQYLFINGRPVASQVVSDALKEAYGNLLEPRAHPAFVLFLSMPAETVDVNIHPRKETVAFTNNQTVAEVLTRSVEAILRKHNLMYVQGDSGNSILNDRGMDGYTADSLKAATDAWQPNWTDDDQEIVQINKLYLITQTPKGMLVVDQHAAHERILYEQFKQAFIESADKGEVYELTEAMICELPVTDMLAVEEHADDLATLGFEIELFGERSIKIRSVPMIFRDRDIAGLIREMLHQLVSETGGNTMLDEITERTLNFLACRSAIKGGDYISPAERKNLIKKLLDTPAGYTCPHGRPTHIEVTRSELDRLFKRA
jgi:DNA mismatch repair protein MutL